MALVLTALSLGVFLASVYPDLLPEQNSNTIFVEYAEGYPSGGCCGNTLVYDMTDDSLLLNIPIYRPPTVWNQTLPPLFAYFYVGTPFPIMNATCFGGTYNCHGTMISSPFKLGDYWWVASNQTWQGCDCLTMRILTSGAVGTDIWGERSLKFSLGNAFGPIPNLSQNATYILRNVFHTSNESLIFSTAGRDVYREPFTAFSMFATQFYFGVIPSNQVKAISPLPLTVLGNGEVVWTVTGQTADPYYGQDKLFSLSTKNPYRDVATAFSGIAFGSFLGLISLGVRRRKSGSLVALSPERTPESISDRILRMIREVDQGFAKPGNGLWLRIFLVQSWAYFILAVTLILVFVNTYIVNFGGGLFAELSFVVAVGSMLFAFMSAFYSRMVSSTVEKYHLNRLKDKYGDEDRPLLLALIRMRNQMGTKLEDLYSIDRSIFTRRELVRRLSETSHAFATK